MGFYVDRSADPRVDAICRIAGFTGKQVEILSAERVHLTGGFWDGGSKSDWFAVRLDTLQAVQMPDYDPPQFGGPQSAPCVTLPPGVILAENSLFRSKHYVRIWCRPGEIAPVLPPAVALSWAERVVLVATKELKSAFRLMEAQQDTGIKAKDYEAAKASLIERKLLNKAGAITTEGRNVVQALGLPLTCGLSTLGKEVGFDRWGKR